jgi:hypothetical protein
MFSGEGGGKANLLTSTLPQVPTAWMGFLGCCKSPEADEQPTHERDSQWSQKHEGKWERKKRVSRYLRAAGRPSNPVCTMYKQNSPSRTRNQQSRVPNVMPFVQRCRWAASNQRGPSAMVPPRIRTGEKPRHVAAATVGRRAEKRKGRKRRVRSGVVLLPTVRTGTVTAPR